MDVFRDSSDQAIPLFEQAIKLDPHFALAFAHLSMAQSWTYHSYSPLADYREKARLNADEALRRQPDLPEGHLALGFSYYYGDRDYDRALAEFEIAKRDLPNNSEAYMAIGAIQRRQGKWKESNANLEKSAELDPNNANVLTNLAFSYLAQRKFELADKTIERALAAAPNSTQGQACRALISLNWKGDLSVAEKAFLALPSDDDKTGATVWAKSGILILEQKFPEALQVIEQYPGETVATNTTAPCPKSFIEGVIYFKMGDQAKARLAFEHARPVAEQSIRDAPEDPGRYAQLGLILSALGQKEEAVKAGKRAVELLPESVDAFDGPQATAALAQIYAWNGELDEAFPLVNHLLEIPSQLTPAILRIDTAWDPLRKDPRFQALLDKYTAN
jgi:tetratricopeptide (TPR) repeat protein